MPTRPELATNPGCPRSRKRSTSARSAVASSAAVGAGTARRRAIEYMVADRSSRYSGSISSLSPSTSLRSSTACWASGSSPVSPGTMRRTDAGSTSQCSSGCRVASKYQLGRPAASATVQPSPCEAGCSSRSWLNSENILASTSRCSRRAARRSSRGSTVAGETTRCSSGMRVSTTALIGSPPRARPRRLPCPRSVPGPAVRPRGRRRSRTRSSPPGGTRPPHGTRPTG